MSGYNRWHGPEVAFRAPGQIVEIPDSNIPPPIEIPTEYGDGTPVVFSVYENLGQRVPISEQASVNGEGVTLPENLADLGVPGETGRTWVVFKRPQDGDELGLLLENGRYAVYDTDGYRVDAGGVVSHAERVAIGDQASRLITTMVKDSIGEQELSVPLPGVVTGIATEKKNDI